jgi:hypothetical protein
VELVRGQVESSQSGAVDNSSAVRIVSYGLVLILGILFVRFGIT